MANRRVIFAIFFSSLLDSRSFNEPRSSLLTFSVSLSVDATTLELLVGIGSDIRTDLVRDLELLFFISVLRGVVDSEYKVSLTIWLKFSDEVDDRWD